MTQSEVAILLCTYNGQNYLTEQLQSIADQTHTNWLVWASDDGSSDDTLPLLEAWRRKWGEPRLHMVEGPARGFSANFLSLACRSDISADYFAFSDQDDIWEKDKLERALSWIETIPKDTPALYCSRTCIIDRIGRQVGLSPLFSRPPSFRNALVQSIGGGNTMVFNEAARELLMLVGADVPVVTHDWWAYMLVTGCGGVVNYDPRPTLRYRQHGHNVIGVNSGWRARLKRLRMLWQGRFREWNDGNILALMKVEQHLAPEEREVFQRFVRLRDSPALPRLLQMRELGLYRQTVLGNLGLAVATLFGKL